MALNFKIVHHQRGNELQLELMGDFDGSSAYELINSLEAHNRKAVRVFINTSNLSSIHPFGMAVFKKSCVVRKLSHCLTFGGDYSVEMALDKSRNI